MTKDQIYQRIVEMLKEEKGEQFQVQMTTPLQDHVVVDSVEIMEFVLNLEDEFCIHISDEVIESFVTLSDIVQFIHEQLI